MQHLQDTYANGKIFELSKDISSRKFGGVFYTPPEIVDYIVQKAMEQIDLVKNPYVKILDPSCGAGYFLITAFEKLKEKFKQDYDKIIAHNVTIHQEIQNNGLEAFIIAHNLWGADIDPEAIDFTRAALLKRCERACHTNLICCDSLLWQEEKIEAPSHADKGDNGFWTNAFDIIIGNPPYIGHKAVNPLYKKQLQKLYPGIYKDKSDIFYCFIKMSIDITAPGGLISFITSRYFMEGPSASGLRAYITDQCRIVEIIDFLGHEIFKEAGVATCIITLKKNAVEEKTAPESSTLILKPGKNRFGEKLDIANFDKYQVRKACFPKEGWMLLSDEKYAIFDRINGRGTHSLSELFYSYQGIITGCDGAFVIKKEDIAKYDVEETLLKPWIKNSHVAQFKVRPFNHFLIYADLIDDEKTYPNAIKFIGAHKERLMTRRECMTGVRKWYQLQWGRNRENFERPKLVYPYKSETNRFAVDKQGYYCSADVYSLVLRPAFEPNVTLEYVAMLLNSKLFEFYFKCFAKKLSNRLYDYYPNTVLRLKIDMNNINRDLLYYSKRILEETDCEQVNRLVKEADQIIYRLYDLKDEQIRIIEESLF